MDIRLARNGVLPHDALTIKKLITSIFPDIPRDIYVSGLRERQLGRYRNYHQILEFMRESGGKEVFTGIYNEAGQRQRLNSNSFQDGTLWHLMWKQNWSSSRPLDRGYTFLVAGIPCNATASDEMCKQLQESISSLRSVGIREYGIRETLVKISSIGRLITCGEKRGLDILASRQEPGLALFNAAASIASIIRENIQNPRKKNVAVVTGFTVVDENGNQIAGENDGPPGAALIAKRLLDLGTPVTLVCDTGSKSSLFAAASALGLVYQAIFPNSCGLKDDAKPILNETFSKTSLTAGLSVEVIDHGPTSDRAFPNTVKKATKALEELNTALVISIERPGPNLSGQMLSMSGENISRYNADMSVLFSNADRKWATIGIGDGGNEIGTGKASVDTRGLRKPDFTPVVKNGANIACKVKTDHMVLAAVSNHGSIALLTALNLLLRHPTISNWKNEFKDIGIGSAVPHGRLLSAEALINDYKMIIRQMYQRGISIDGVTKKNALSVDGRRLSRPRGEKPQRPGSSNATHDDILDQLSTVTKATMAV